MMRNVLGTASAVLLTLLLSPPPLSAAGKAPVAVSHSASETRLLVRLREGLSRADKEAIKRDYGAIALRALARLTPPQNAFGRWHRFEFKNKQQRDRYMEKLHRDKRIEFIEPDYRVSTDSVPNDPDFYRLWGLHNTGQPTVDLSQMGYEDADIDAPEAWGVATAPLPVVVAIIDTGIEYSHPDLATNMWVNAAEIPGNGIDDDNNGYIDDVYGYDFVNADSDPVDDNFHGTHVSGTIAAVRNNDIGVAGVSSGARLMALKALDADGGGWTSDTAVAVDYAVGNGAKIINASLGGYSYSQLMYDAISAANAAGVLFVAAAGNENNDNDLQQHYPSGYDLPNIISVAASDRLDARASFSNYGRNSVDIGAPGAEIYSTSLNGGYMWANGTSAAAPHIAGAAAVLLGQDPSLTIAGIKAVLENQADSLPSMAGITTSGKRLNLWRALTCDETPSLTAELRSTESGFAAYWSEPTQLQVFVSNCGAHVLGAAVEVSFDNGENTLSLFDDGGHGDGIAGDGVYGNTWFPQQVGPVSITATASDATTGTVSDVRTGNVWQRVTYRHEDVAFSWVDASGGQSHQLGDDGTVTLPIGFDFSFFGVSKGTVTVSANGFITFDNEGVVGAENEKMPNPALPNDVVAALWDDLDPQLGGSIYTLVDGVSPDRRFTVSWVNIQRKGGSLPVSFQVTLMEGTGEIIVRYSLVDFGNPLFDGGASASVGIESADGLDGTPYSFNQPLLTSGSAHRFYPVAAVPEISYKIGIDLAPIRSTAGSLIVDFIDGDGVNNNQFKILEFSTEGELVLNPELLGDATGTMVPGPARVGDAQFLNEISQVMIYGNTLSFKLNTSPAGEFLPFPDTLSLYLMDANGKAYATDDPLGLNQLLSVEIDSFEPHPEAYLSQYAAVSIETVGLPIADVGGPYSGYINEPVQFDGTGSSDPEEAPLTYFWSFGDGTTATGPTPTHTYTTPGTYQVSLTVNDGLLTSEVSETSAVIAPNHLPVAVAGGDQVIYGEQTVQLDGSASHDVDGTIVAYSWSQTGGPAVTLGSPDAAVTTFAAPSVAESATLTFALSVTDDYGDTTQDEVVINLLPYDQDSDSDGLADGWEWEYFGTLHTDPNADADGDGIPNVQEFAEGTDPLTPEPAPQPVTTLAAEPGDGQVTISWSAVPSTARYDLYRGTSPTISKLDATKLQGVTSPYVHTGLTNNTTYYYFVVAVNNTGESPESTIVNATPGVPPVADPAGPYSGHIDEPVQFDGSGSYDPDGLALTYTWDFGDGATGSGANPSHTYGAAGTYTVGLTVSDGYMSASVETTATIVANYPPTAAAGPDQTVFEQESMQLDGSASTDSDGTVVSYSWSQISGPYASLSGASTATPAVTTPSVSAETTLTFQLTVTDDAGDQASDTVDVVVLDYDADADADGLPDGWEYLYFGDLTQGPANDPDGDGFDNLRELADGTSPVEPAPIPETPQLSVIPGDGETLLLWPDVPNTLRYDIYWSTTPGVTPANGNLIQDVSSPYFHTAQRNGLPYYYVVVAANNAGTSSASAELFSVPQERQWSSETSTPVSSMNEAHIATSANGDAMMTWAAYDGSLFNAWSRRYTRAGGWEEPLLIKSTSQAVSSVQVAMDGNGNAIATWAQLDDEDRYNLYAARYVSGQGWGQDSLLENYDGNHVGWGSVKLATVKANHDGHAVVVWLQEDLRYGTDGVQHYYDTAYANYYTRGKGWSGRVQIAPDDAGNDYYPEVEIDEQGNAIAVWRHSHSQPDYTYYTEIHTNRYVADQGSWSGFSVVGPNTAGDPSCRCGPDYPVLSVAGDGGAALGYVNYDGATVMTRYTPGSGWSTIDTPNTSRDDSQVLAVAATDGGHITATWLRMGNQSNDLMVRSYTPATGWEAETSVYSGNIYTDFYTTRMHTDAAGRAALVWEDTATSTYFLSRVVDGAWVSSDIVTGGSYLDSATSYGGDLVTVWKETTTAKTKHFHVPYQATVPPLAPIADAGPDLAVLSATTVTLDGTASLDPDGAIVSYEWTQLSGTAVTLSGATTVTATFTAPSVKQPETLSFELTVTDDSGMHSTDQVTVTVSK